MYVQHEMQDFAYIWDRKKYSAESFSLVLDSHRKDSYLATFEDYNRNY